MIASVHRMIRTKVRFDRLVVAFGLEIDWPKSAAERLARKNLNAGWDEMVWKRLAPQILRKNLFFCDPIFSKMSGQQP